MVEIVDAKLNNVDEIYNLLDANFTYEKFSKDVIKNYIENVTKIDCVKILKVDGDFCGVLIYRVNDIAELINICIREDMRNQDYGTFLMKLMFYNIDTYNIELKDKCKTKEEFAEKLCKKVILEVRSKNINAIKLYNKEKFVQIDIRKNYYKEPADDCIVMEKKIIC